MDILQLIRSLEEFTYEIVLLILFLPKTLIRFAFQPARVRDYVSAELEKPTGDQFRSYLSPILYWILVGVVPAFVVINNVIDHARTEFAHNVAREPLEIRFASIIVLLIWPPLTFAIASLIRCGTDLSREAIRRPFYIQSMLLAPFYPVIMGWGYFGLHAKRVNNSSEFVVFFCAAAAWFFPLFILERNIYTLEGAALSRMREQLAALSGFVLFPGLYIGLSWLVVLIFALNQ